MITSKFKKNAIALAIAALTISAASAETYENRTGTYANNNDLSQAWVHQNGSSIKDAGNLFQNNKITITAPSGAPTAVGIAAMGTSDNQISVEVDNDTFTNNSVTDGEGSQNGVYGVAVGVNNSNLIVSNSKFTQNVGKSYNQVQGTAIYHSTGTIDVSNSNFNENKAEGVGGTIDHADFTDNSAISEKQQAYGGALYLRSGVWGGENDLTVTVSNSTFVNNSLYVKMKV